MALQLQATHAPDYVVQLADEPITLGRRREQGVSSTLVSTLAAMELMSAAAKCQIARPPRPCLICIQVSRDHVTVTASDATCALVTAVKRSFMTRAATAPEARPEILRPLDVTQVRRTALPFSGQPASPLIGCPPNGLVGPCCVMLCGLGLQHAQLLRTCQCTQLNSSRCQGSLPKASGKLHAL